MIDGVLRVTSVTGAYSHGFLQKLRRKMHKIIRHMIGKCCHIFSTAHTLSLLDFNLFLKLKKSIRWHHFLTLEELSTASTKVTRQMKRHHAYGGIVKLPRCWNLVIEEQEDYIKGL